MPPPTDLATQLSTYFAGNADANPPSEPVPQSFEDSLVTALVDASEYFGDLVTELANLGTGASAADNAGQFILIAGWWLGLAGGSYVPATLAGGSGTPARPPSITGEALLSVATPSVVNVKPLTIDAPAPAGTTKLIDELKTKAQAGVDVRVLGWTHAGIMSTVAFQALGGLKSIAAINSMTMESIKELRAEATIGNKAVLNVIAHTAGAVHSKLVVLGTPTRWVAYTGGIDFEVQRWGDNAHHPPDMLWHDVMAKVEGPATQALYEWFKDMWTENVDPHPARKFKYAGETMESYLPGAPAVPAASAPSLAPAAGQHHVQSLRTVPQMNFTRFNCLPSNPPISFAPNGLFEVHTAVKKALTNASSYVYIEDQSLWAQETLGFVNAAIKTNPGLHVVLLTSGRVDPNDPSFPFSYLATAVNHHLLDGLNPAQIAQVRLFKRLSDVFPVPISAVNPAPVQVTVTGITAAGTTVQAQTSYVPKGADGQPMAVPADAVGPQNFFLFSPAAEMYPILGNPASAAGTPVTLTVEQPPQYPALSMGTYSLAVGVGVTVHTKSVIVDDVWAMIGSANTMRRSLYTDLEQSVSVIDGDTTDPFAKEYRKKLWAHHLGGSASDYDDLDKALHVWEATWGTAGVGDRPATVRNVPLPLSPDTAMTDKDQSKYDWYDDPDSQSPWGGLCPPT